MHLTFHLTSRCNLRCRYCYANPSEDTDMTFDTVKSAISLSLKSLADKPSDQSLGIIFFGGEPLLKLNLIKQTTAHCKDIQQKTGQTFHFKITTNGTLLDEEFMTNPKTSDILIALSHDGIREAHDTNRVDSQNKGTFDRLDPVIDVLLKHHPYAPVMKVTTPNTVPYFAESVEYLYNRGFKYLICSLDYSSDWTEKDMASLAKQYKKLSNWYYRETVKEEKFYFSPFEVKISSHIYPGSCKAERCELGQTQISIAPDGKIYPCVQFVGDSEFCIGNVTDGIDESVKKRLYELNREEKDTCRECAIRERCNHYCGCLNRQATGRIDTVSPTQCAHERLIMPIADKLSEKLYSKRAPMFIQKHYNDLFPLVSLVEDTSKQRSKK